MDSNGQSNGFRSSSSSSSSNGRAYITLLTRASYLPGVIILAHTLQRHSPPSQTYPLIVLVTPSLGTAALNALEQEARLFNLLIAIEPVEPLIPDPSQTTAKDLIAARFEDTWTKLRAFEFYAKYRTLVFLDADMTVRRPIAELFESPIVELAPSDRHLAAVPVCACNLDGDAWCPPEWGPARCAHTPPRHPAALSVGGIGGEGGPIRVPKAVELTVGGKRGGEDDWGAVPPPSSSPPSNSAATSPAFPTHAMLNSGLLLFHPTERLWNDMLHAFRTSMKLHTYKCPDQDFLSEFFRDRWSALPWRFNALKPMRYWHGNLWSGRRRPKEASSRDVSGVGTGEAVRNGIRSGDIERSELERGHSNGDAVLTEGDESVSVLHYIVDKPWSRRIASDGIAGHLGRDGATHAWWWQDWETWRAEREARGGEEGIAVVRAVESEGGVALPLDDETDEKQQRENREKGLPRRIPIQEGMSREAEEGVVAANRSLKV